MLRYLAPALFLALPIQTSLSEERFSASFDTEANLIDLGQAILPNGDIAAPCFQAPKELRTEQRSGWAEYRMSIVDGSDASWASRSLTTESSFGGGFSIGVSGGSGSFSRKITQSSEYKVNARVLRVVLDIQAETLKEYLNDYQLNELGKAYVALGPRSFVSNCGALIARELKRSVRIQTLIEFSFDSQEEKNAASSRLSASLGGNYGAFSANASFTQTMDRAFGYSTTRVNTTVTAYVRAENGIHGLDSLTSSLKDLNTSPFSSVITALTELVKSKINDRGAVDLVTFDNFDRAIPSFHLLDWNSRKSFWARINIVQTALRRLIYVDDGRTDSRHHFATEAEKLLRKAARERVCAALIRRETLPSFYYRPNIERFCSKFGIRFASEEYGLQLALQHCLSANKKQDFYCTDAAIAAPLAGVLYALYPSQLEATDRIEGITPTTETMTEEQQVSSGASNFKHFMVISTDESDWNPTNIKRIYEAYRCCMKYPPGETIDLFIADGSGAWAEILKPLELNAALTGGHPIAIGSSYSDETASVWIRANVEVPGYTIEIDMPSGISVHMVHGDSNVITNAGEPLLYWNGDGEDCRNVFGGACRVTLKSIREYLVKYNQPYAAIYLSTDTLLGKQRIFLANVRRP